MDNHPNASPPSNYVLEHWAGQHSLARAYWINAWAISFAVILTVTSIVFVIESNIRDLRIVSLAWVMFWAFFLALGIWGIVGVWRSANRHVARGGRAFWAIAAQTIMFFSAIYYLGYSANTIIPQAIEYSRVMIGNDPFKRGSVITLTPNGDAVAITGPIGQGAHAQFSAIVNDNREVKNVVLNSTGGRSIEATWIGELISENRMNTYVEGDCLSACTLILLSGVERAATPNARIGFHQPDFPGWERFNLEAASSRLLAEYIHAGIDPEFARRAATTPHDEYWFPPIQEMLDSNVLTRISVGGEFILPHATGLTRSEEAALEKALGSNPAAEALREAAPNTYSNMIRDAMAAIKSGKNDIEIQTVMRKHVYDVFRQRMPYASDDALLSTHKLLLDQLIFLSGKNDTWCARFLHPDPVTGVGFDPVAVFPSSMRERDIENTAHVIRSYNPNRRHPPDEFAWSIVEPIVMSIREKYDEQALLPDQNPSLTCQAAIELFSMMGQLPPLDRAIAYRYLISE